MKKLFIRLIEIIIALVLLALGISAYTALTAEKDIALTYTGDKITEDALRELESIEPQCILVLGCAVWLDNQPSPMLQDRLDTAIELYKAGVAPKLLLSCDNSIESYSEPDCMYHYALEHGVPEEDIFLDFAGFSTYDTMYRARDVFCADRVIVVTQKYHLFRALKIGKALNMEVKGAAAGQRAYHGRYFREAREVLARDKDFIKCIIKPEPVFLGDKIPVDGDGRVTHLN